MWPRSFTFLDHIFMQACCIPFIIPAFFLSINHESPRCVIFSIKMAGKVRHVVISAVAQTEEWPGCGLDDRGSNPDRAGFLSSPLCLGLDQLPIQCVPWEGDLSLRKNGLGMELNTPVWCRGLERVELYPFLALVYGAVLREAQGCITSCLLLELPETRYRFTRMH
jgi:hypothetical protein